MRGIALALLILATPVSAEEPPAPVPPTDDGWSLMERGAQMLLEGLMTEVEPALDEMGQALSELEPALREMQPALLELVRMIGDLHYYHAPEKMPNGDIIIRRKTEPELQMEGLPAPEIEL